MPVQVLHPITRLIVGGAQENTMLTAALLNQGAAGFGRYAVTVVSGGQTGPEGSLIGEVRQRGVPLEILPQLRREVAPLADWQALRHLQRLMTGAGGQPRYDIVHTHSSKAGVLGRIAAYRAQVPVIVHTVHGWSFHNHMPAVKRQLYVVLEKLAYRLGHAMIVVSPRDIDKGLTAGIGRRDDYVVIRSGIELDRFGHPQVTPAVMRAQLGLPAGAPVVGSVTRLSAQKAPLDMVAAMVQIGRQRPDVHFVVVGDGPLRPQVEQALQAGEIAHRTRLTGLRRDVPELMACFDLFLLSSLWEGLPRVLPQAMASGLAIVCTRADGSAEAVQDGVNGFLAPPGDPPALAAAALRLLDDGALRGRMAAAGRQLAAEFDVRRMVQDIDALYRRLRAARGLV